MTDQHTYDEEGGQFQDIEGAQYMPRVPYPFPLPLPRASGLYQWRMPATVHPRLVPERLPNPIGPGHGAEEPAESFSESSQELSIAYPWWFSREELRLDIDGRYPQMTASGTAFGASPPACTGWPAWHLPGPTAGLGARQCAEEGKEVSEEAGIGLRVGAAGVPCRPP